MGETCWPIERSIPLQPTPPLLDPPQRLSPFPLRLAHTSPFQAIPLQGRIFPPPPPSPHLLCTDPPELCKALEARDREKELVRLTREVGV